MSTPALPPELAGILFATCSQGLLVVAGRDGRLLAANPAVVDLGGWTREVLLRRHLQDLVVPAGGQPFDWPQLRAAITNPSRQEGLALAGDGDDDAVAIRLQTVELATTEDPLLLVRIWAAPQAATARARRFARTVIHRLRNHLGAIPPSVFVLRRRLELDDPKVEQALSRIDDAVRDCETLLERTAAYVRGEALDRDLTRPDAEMAEIEVAATGGEPTI